MTRVAASTGASLVVSLILLTAGFAYTLFEHGGVELVGWNLWLLALGLVGTAYWLFTARSDVAPPMNPWLRWAVALFPCYVALQLIPAPLWLLRIVSPTRAHILDSLSPLTSAPGLAALSVTPANTFTHLFRILGYTLTFLLIRELTSRAARRQWPWMTVLPLIGLTTLEAGLGLLQRQEYVQGTYGSRNHFAGLLEMVLPLTAAYACALFSRGLSRRTPSMANVIQGCVVLFLAAVIFAGVLFSLSKMGYAACLGGLFAMGALALGTSGLAWKKTAVAGLLAACLLGFLWLRPVELVERFNALDDTTGEGRLPIWRDTLRLIGDYPVFGSGLGTYDSAFLRYQTSVIDSAFPFAHNDYLQVAAELGMAGFLIAAVLMLKIFGRALRAARRGPDSDIRYLGIGCAGAMSAIFIHSLADFNLYIPANAVVLAWICGIVAGLPLRSHPVVVNAAAGLRARWMNVPTLATVAGLLLLAYAPAWILFEIAFRSDQQAEQRFCRFGICDTEAVVNAQAVLHQRKIAAPMPLAVVKEALARDANNPERWLDAGDATLRAGDVEKASVSFSNAVALGHDDPPVLLRAAAYLFKFNLDRRALLLTSRLLGETASYDEDVFDLYRKSRIPVVEILERGLPRTQRAYGAYLRSFMAEGPVDDALKVWSGVNGRGYADGPLANEYVAFLISKQRPEDAAEAWADFVGARRAGYLKSTWLYNGDFEFDPSGSALDWRIDPVSGVDVAADESMAHSGTRSLRIHFRGLENVDFHHINQTAFVTPGSYRLEGYIRTEDITTDQGVSFHIFDPEAGGRLEFQTEQVTGTNQWRKLERSFCVTPQTRLIAVQVTRPASWKFYNKISGTAWIDSVRLWKAGGECGARTSVESASTP